MVGTGYTTFANQAVSLPAALCHCCYAGCLLFGPVTTQLPHHDSQYEVQDIDVLLCVL